MAKKYTVQPAGNMSALRQSGRFETHAGDCSCRKCRRARKARDRRVKPRYGQAIQNNKQATQHGQP